MHTEDDRLPPGTTEPFFNPPEPATGETKGRSTGEELRDFKERMRDKYR